MFSLIFHIFHFCVCGLFLLLMLLVINSKATPAFGTLKTFFKLSINVNLIMITVGDICMFKIIRNKTTNAIICEGPIGYLDPSWCNSFCIFLIVSCTSKLFKCSNRNYISRCRKQLFPRIEVNYWLIESTHKVSDDYMVNWITQLPLICLQNAPSSEFSEYSLCNVALKPLLYNSNGSFGNYHYPTLNPILFQLYLRKHIENSEKVYYETLLAHPDYNLSTQGKFGGFTSDINYLIVVMFIGFGIILPFCGMCWLVITHLKGVWEREKLTRSAFAASLLDRLYFVSRNENLKV